MHNGNNVPAARTRLAPSPTGALHLGNARTFLINWILAKRNGWRITLRVEDLDGPRVKAGADRAAIDDLRWLGLDWNDGPVYQTTRAALYRQAIDQLLACGAAYPCVCTRREIELAASAPHAEDGASVYPGTCRGRFKSMEEAASSTGRAPAVRFAALDQAIEWTDEFRGRQSCNPFRQLGDFVIAKADGTPAYQLAVVVDDAQMGVNRVVRGDDLIDSTPRQILVYRSLGIEHLIPQYWHLPLVVGQDGLRLAKRHGDTRLGFYREQGVNPQRVLALMARWLGLGQPNEIELSEIAKRFELQNLPKTPIVFRSEDDAWLRRG